MACMHEKTFEIYYNDLRIVPDGYVEIDELIAPAIQVLNCKGYITTGCCSGHSLEKTLTVYSTTGELGYEIIDGPVYSTHIMFKLGVSLPMLPPEFKMKSKPVFPPDFFVNNPPDEHTTHESIIEFSIGNALIIEKGMDFRGGFFESSRNILETMEQLYKWALNLPDFKAE